MASATDLKSSKPKAFIPLENNPEVMSSLLHKLGLSPTLQFHDVFSIDSPELLAFIPRPAYALLLVFPVSDAYEKSRVEEDKNKAEYEGKGKGEEVMWFRQTIRNACGLIGLLHGVANGEAKNHIQQDSGLDKLLAQAVDLDPTARAQLLYDSTLLEAAHQEAGAQGDTSAPNADDRVDLHFVCFVKSANGHLWELDGRRKGPLDRGALDGSEDVLSEKALELGVKAFLKREGQEGEADLRFSCVALAPSLE